MACDLLSPADGAMNLIQYWPVDVMLCFFSPPRQFLPRPAQLCCDQLLPLCGHCVVLVASVKECERACFDPKLYHLFLL